MRHVREVQPDPKKGWMWRAVIFDWTKADCDRYIDDHGLRRNEVVDVLHMSGECLCGAYARPGEREELELWYPDVAARIDELEARVSAAGHAACVWGRRPPDVHRQQMVMDAGMLCSGCQVAA
jgi:hypothetical protein